MGEVSAKPVDQEPDAFVADIDAALMEQVFYISERERKSDVHQDGQLDDLGRSLKVPEWIFRHELRLSAPAPRLKAVCPDNSSRKESSGQHFGFRQSTRHGNCTVPS